MRHPQRAPGPETGPLEKLFAEIRKGSASAFDRLYGMTAPMVRAIALQILGDPMDAEDVCHDVFLHVISHPERYDPSRGSVEAWLAVLAKSRATDRLRRKKRLLLAAEREKLEGNSWTAPQADAEPESRVLAKLQSEAVRLALLEVPVAQRQALAAAYYQGRTQRELAEEWRVPLGTVKSRVRYGLGHLRRALAHMGWAEAEGGDGRV